MLTYFNQIVEMYMLVIVFTGRCYIRSSASVMSAQRSQSVELLVFNDELLTNVLYFLRSIR